MQQRYYKQLHLSVVGIKYFTKRFDLQLKLCEKLVHYSKKLEQESAALHFQVYNS